MLLSEWYDIAVFVCSKELREAEVLDDEEDDDDVQGFERQDYLVDDQLYDEGKYRIGPIGLRSSSTEFNDVYLHKILSLFIVLYVKLPWSDGLVLVVMRWPRVVLSDSLDVPASDVKLPWSDGLVTSCDEMASCCAV